MTAALGCSPRLRVEGLTAALGCSLGAAGSHRLHFRLATNDHLDRGSSIPLIGIPNFILPATRACLWLKPYGSVVLFHVRAGGCCCHSNKHEQARASVSCCQRGSVAVVLRSWHFTKGSQKPHGTGGVLLWYFSVG